MSKFQIKNIPSYVYVMRSDDNFVKIGISKNIVTRATTEKLNGEKKKIVAIAYNAEKIDRRTALIYEAALLGFYRKYIISGSEWVCVQWKKVVETLDFMFESKIFKIGILDSETLRDLNDKYMRNEGYTERYVALNSRFYYGFSRVGFRRCNRHIIYPFYIQKRVQT